MYLERALVEVREKYLALMLLKFNPFQREVNATLTVEVIGIPIIARVATNWRVL